MRKIFLFVACAVLSAHVSVLSAQQKYDYVGQTGLNAAIFRGPEAVKYPFMYQGTPYIYSEMFSQGSLVYNGVKYEGVELNLNAHRGELHLRIPTSGIVLELDKELVEGFVIGTHRFEMFAGARATDGLPQGFYELLYTGSDTLIKKNRKVYTERLQTSAKGFFRHFEPASQYYLIKDGKVFQISWNRDFAGVYRENKKAIKSFIRRNRGRFADDEQRDRAFIATLEFINKNCME